MKALLGLYRENLYSPERESDDAMILRRTGEVLQAKGFSVQLKTLEEVTAHESADAIFAMCEGPKGIDFLRSNEARGRCVVNSPQAVLNCHRWKMWPLLEKEGIPLPSTIIVSPANLNGSDPPAEKLWIKRGDVHNTQEGGDVVYVESDEEMKTTLEKMSRRGIEKVLIQEHLDGDLVKFYGILGTDWFKWFYHRGIHRGYKFDENHLRTVVNQAAKTLGLEIYGGDVIVSPDRMDLIDINSWPSFALCREEASQEIARYLERRFSE